MKFKSAIVSTAVVGICLTPIWGAHVIWRLGSKHTLNLLVVDYTVAPSQQRFRSPLDAPSNYTHHRGLFWLLNHVRVFPSPFRGYWRLESDYMGFRPDRLDHQRLKDADPQKHSAVYVADTYGVYSFDVADPHQEKIANVRGTQLIFGGLIEADALWLQRFADQGKDVILEFNAFITPTEDRARTVAESVLGVKWSGWCGRFFQQLNDLEAIPVWLPPIFKRQYPERSLPSGPGLLFVHRGGRVVVLSEKPFEQSAPSIAVTTHGQFVFKGPFANPPYFGWFAIMKADTNTEVLAELVLPSFEDWDRDLFLAGVPTRVPLLTRLERHGSSRYYLAANAANLDEDPGSFRLAGLPWIQAAINRRRDHVSEKPVFWQFYVPIMGQVLKSISAKKSNSR